MERAVAHGSDREKKNKREENQQSGGGRSKTEKDEGAEQINNKTELAGTQERKKKVYDNT